MTLSASASAAKTKALDFLGRRIRAGYTIVYPVRRGARMWLTQLEVLAVGNDRGRVWVGGVSPLGRKIKVRTLANCIIVAGGKVPQPMPASAGR